VNLLEFIYWQDSQISIYLKNPPNQNPICNIFTFSLWSRKIFLRFQVFFQCLAVGCRSIRWRPGETPKWPHFIFGQVDCCFFSSCQPFWQRSRVRNSGNKLFMLPPFSYIFLVEEEIRPSPNFLNYVDSQGFWCDLDSL